MDRIIFKKGQRVRFRDQNFRSKIGKIIEVLDCDEAIITLLVKEDSTGSVHIVKKIYPDDMEKAIKHYQKYGAY